MAVTLEGVYKLVDRASPSLDAIKRKAEAADRALDKLGRTMDRMEARQLASDVAGANTQLGKMEQITAKVDRASRSASTSQGGFNKELDDTSTKSRKATSDLSKFEQVMRKILLVSGGLGKVLVPAKFALIGAAIAPVLQMVTALGAGAVALVQQLGSATTAVVPIVARMGQLAGVGAAAATALISVKAAVLVTKLAFGGITQAMDGNKKAFAALTPQAKAFVTELKKIQPVLNTIKSSAQKGLFGGLTSALQTARQNGGFQFANQAAGGIGSAVGGVAQQAAQSLLSPSSLRDLASVSGTVDVVITKLGGAAISLAGGFRSILVTAEPLTRWLASSIKQWADYANKQVQTARYSGELAHYFSETRQAVTNVARAVRDFGAGFMTIMHVASSTTGTFGTGIDKIAASFRKWTEDVHNQASVALYFDRARASAHEFGSILESTLQIFLGLGKASQNLGRSMTGGIDTTMKRWAVWVNSFAGQNSLNRWFNNARGTLSSLWKLVSDLSSAFVHLGSNGAGAQGLLSQLDSLIPDLTKLLQSFSTNLGPGLFGTVTQLVKLLSTIASSGSSPLGQMLNATSSILTNVNSILDRFKGVRLAAVTAITVIGGALLIQKLQRIVGGVDGIRAKWAQVTSATKVAQAAAMTYEGTVAAVQEGMAASNLVAGGGAAVMAARTAGEATSPGGVILPTGGAAARATEAGVPGVIPVPAAAEEAASGGRLGNLLKSPAGGMVAAIAAPIVANLALGALQSRGTIGGRTASNVGNVVNMASTGALVGSFIEPGLGTVVGGGVGAGVGLAENMLGGGSSSSPTQRYLASLGRTASHQGFDISQSQGGATTLAGANRYEKVLDQSLTRLRTERSTLAVAAQQVPWMKSQLDAVNQQIVAARKLRGENLDRLGVERKTANALKDQARQIAAQNRAKNGRSQATNLMTSYARAINVDQTQGHMSLNQAVATEVGSIDKRIAGAKNPAFARQLGNEALIMLTALKKDHPALSKEYDSVNKTVSDKLKAMGTLVTTQSGKIVTVSGRVWGGLAASLQTPIQQAFVRANQKAGLGLTALQKTMLSVLLLSGRSKAQAMKDIAAATSGQKALTITQFDAGSFGGSPNLNALTAKPKGFAGGGRIGGSGLGDTVPLMMGMAAPGELIVNRHTEAKVNAKLGGSTLGGLVANESKRHSDILPGYATGGRVGAAVNEANRIAAMRSTYLFGGGHVTPAPASPPWDCSSSTSRVLQAAGYNIPTMTAQQFMNWGQAGEGAIGVEASPGHVYMMLNGKPWGTSYSNYKGGPGWIQNGSGYRPGFVKRHAPNAGGGGARGAAAKVHLTRAQQVARAFQGTLAMGNAGGGAGALLGAGGGAGGSPSDNQTLARAMMMQSGQGAGQWPYLQKLWTRESGFSTTAKNPSSGAYGIPQSLPASKMASSGADYLTNPRTQIDWGLGYISGRYGSPSAAWAHETSHNWYSKGGRTPSWGGWHANGLDRTFSSPTVIGVGERGAERVTVTPHRAGSGARSVSIDVSGGIHIHGGTNASVGEIERLIDEALEKLARRIETQALSEGA